MGLQRYREMRDFRRTPEPRGTVVRSHGPLRFVVQKHAATGLHYDFRLEIDGVLKSWAVPKGPSEDPAEKRLAVHTEDHPVEYAGFEGKIPEGEYGAGVMHIWDEGTWIPDAPPVAAYRRGRLAFELKGRRLKGHWTLVRMGNAQTAKKDLWLLVRREKAQSRSRASASRARTASSSPKWASPRKRSRATTKPSATGSSPS
jgi:bifunctional non-homologous end joining protein LigD